jgi:LysR family transcriptional regulator, glycine cleavage system transcriptional activator
MPSKLPPLPALKAFECAGRHQNYSHAAAELFVTHGAVSHHVKSLETALGIKLFERNGREMLLTDAGRVLHGHVSEAFERLRRGVQAVRLPDHDQVLSLSVLPAFAARWLVPRLSEFQQQHPDIDLLLRANHALADFSEDSLDVAIRYGLGSWPKVTAELLMSEDVFPVCSPDYRGGRVPRSPAELLECSLLHDLYQPWCEWFRSVGVEPPQEMRGPRFNESNSLLRAAIDGQGVALALGAHVQTELSSGQLLKCHAGLRTRFAYYFVRRRGRAPAKIRVFRDWLFEQIQSDASA